MTFNRCEFSIRKYWQKKASRWKIGTRHINFFETFIITVKVKKDITGFSVNIQKVAQ